MRRKKVDTAMLEFPPGGNLAVTMPDGKKIRHRYAPDTFVEVLEEIGLENVARLDIKCRYQPLISLHPIPDLRQRKSGIYYINVDTHWRYMSTMLYRIGITLDIDLKLAYGAPVYYTKKKKYRLKSR